jgi:hypothetical protein
MARAQSLPQIASCWWRTSSFRTEPYKPQETIGLGIFVCLGRAHVICAPIACSQTAGGANVRFASVL